MKFNRKLATALGLLAASAMLTACGPAEDGGDGDSCGANEVRTKLPADDEAQCYTDCSADASVCDSGEVCQRFAANDISLCVADTGGGDGCTDDSDCAAGETCNAGTCEAAPGCTEDSDCNAGETCENGTCEAGPECAANSDCAAGEVCTNGACVTDTQTQVPQCDAYCQNIFGSCPKNTCTGLDATDTANLDASYDACLNGGTAQDGTVLNPCAQDYLSDAQFAQQVDQFAAETCGNSPSLTNVYCGQFGFGEKCDCVEPNPGAACTTDDDCEGGTLNAACIAETDENGEDTGFPGGVCISGPCDAGSTMAGAGAIGPQTGCGAEGFCINEQSQQGVQSICYKQCSVNTDCRDGYACEVIGFFTNGDPAGRCQPACATNDDCPVYTLNADPNTQLNSFCNADGWCEIPCNPAEADSCGDSGQQVCTTRTDLNAATDFTGSCALSGN